MTQPTANLTLSLARSGGASLGLSLSLSTGTSAVPPVVGSALWLDALRPGTLFQDAARTTLAGVGDPVGSWFDPDAGIGATQSGAARPVRAAAGLTFDGVNDALVMGALPVHTWPGMTWIQVMQFAAPLFDYMALGSIAQSSVARWGFGHGDAPNRHGWAGSAANVGLGSPVGNHSAATPYVVAYRKSAADWRIQRNAVDGSSIADTSFPTAAPTIWLGAEAISSSWFFGEARMILVYPRALSDAELSAVVAWAAARHGVTL